MKTSLASYAAAYTAALLAMALLDGLWLGLIAKPLYQQGIGHLMAESPNLWAAALFYLLFPLGLLVFAVQPGAVPTRAWGETLGAAAMFGFFTYATYDLSNLATLKAWPVGLALVDVAWGCAISTASAAAAKLAVACVR
jgi:uncharacterized membrane protein